MPIFEDLADGVVAEEKPALKVSATYLDTDDLRLTGWGVSLRHRTNDGWTVKLPHSGGGKMLVREEHVFPGDVRRPPAEALDLVRAFARTAALSPQVRLRTVRRETRLSDGEGQHLADVVDDDVSVLDGRRIAARFRELEVETGDEAHDELVDALVAHLRQSGAGAPDPTPKVVRALGPRAGQPRELSVAKLRADATIGDVVRNALAASVERLIRHDPVVRLDTDVEGVHQARVATRRLRSDLRTFRDLLDPEWAKALRDELGWLADGLGAVRDGDVLLGRMRKRAATLPAEVEKGASRVLASLEDDRARAYGELLETLRGERYVALLDRLVAAANAPVFQVDPEAAAKAVLQPLLSGPLRAVAKQVSSLDAEPDDDELHGVRIKTKRARYASEAVAPVLGKRARAAAEAAADLQDVLGEHHDAVVAERWLREWARASRSVGGAFAAGELAGLERAAATRARKRWRKSWKALSRAS